MGMIQHDGVEIATSRIMYESKPITITADQALAVSRPVQRIGSIKSHAILGGLHHHYARA